MPIRLEELRQASARPHVAVAKSLTEARTVGLKTAFLCHSHQDSTLVSGMVKLLREAGWNVYVDWQDTTMPATPDRQTAEKIKDRVKAATYFLFLATPNSVVSRWCPWEIGFADGVKPVDSIFIISTRDDAGNHYGNEYLQLYRRIDFSDAGDLASWRPGQTTGGVYVRSL